MKVIAIAVFVMASAGFAACGDDSGGAGNNDTNSNNANDNTNGNTNQNTNQNTNYAGTGHYAGAGSHGDLVTFTIDRGQQTYEVHNETTNQDDSGAYQVLGETLEGIYEISDGASMFYAVELNDKILAANFPTGNPDNTISFGMSSDHRPQVQDIAGDYVYFAISSEPVNGSSSIKEWGLVHIGDDGSLQGKSFATGAGDATDYPDMAPEALVNPFPIAEPDFDGNWALDDQDPPAFNLVDGEGTIQARGYMYADPSQAAFVLDMGEGNGFVLGFHIYEVTSVAAIAGDYKFINVWTDSNMTGRSAGVLSLDASGQGSFAHLDVDGNLSTGTVDGLTQCPALPNMFYFDSTETGHGATVHERFYFVIMNEMVMGFGFQTDNDEFVFTSYSAGAKI